MTEARSPPQAEQLHLLAASGAGAWAFDLIFTRRLAHDPRTFQCAALNKKLWPDAFTSIPVLQTEWLPGSQELVEGFPQRGKRKVTRWL